MKNIISFISYIPTTIFILSPSICGALLCNELISMLFFQVVLFVAFPFISGFMNAKNKKEDVENIVISNYFYIFTFLVTLFVEVLICSDQRLRFNVDRKYYVPGFVFDLLSPNNLALKLVSITAIFLFVILLNKKAKTLF